MFRFVVCVLGCIPVFWLLRAVRVYMYGVVFGLFAGALADLTRSMGVVLVMVFGLYTSALAVSVGGWCCLR